jgi:signal transduction histidine kinase
VLAAVVVVADTALLVAGHRGGLPWWVVAAYAVVVALVIALRYRAPEAAFIAALVLAALSGGAYVLLLWAAYQAGHAVVSRSGTAVVTGAALGGLCLQLAIWPAGARTAVQLASVYLVFVGLPLLAGRYLAQHERLVSALDRHNRQLRRQRDLLAERERLRERLRIARDMHDSLGHRLSLVSVQAAALEVSDLPPPQRDAVRHLAGAARSALDELYELVGALRGPDQTAPQQPGVEAIAALVEEFRAAGVAVDLREGGGQPCQLSAAAGQVAYRVVQEGLTNAAKHAPGEPVTVSVGWEPDALLLTIVNPVPEGASGPAATGAGHGLFGLGERVQPVGGLLDHRGSDGRFRLFAMLPADLGAAGEEMFMDHLPMPGRMRAVAIAFATAAMMFVILPATMVVGVR